MAKPSPAQILGATMDYTVRDLAFKIAPVSSLHDAAAFEFFLKQRWLSQHRAAHTAATAGNLYRDNELTMRILQQSIPAQELFGRLNSAEGFIWMLRHSIAKAAGGDDAALKEADGIVGQLTLDEQVAVAEAVLELSGLTSGDGGEGADPKAEAASPAE